MQTEDLSEEENGNVTPSVHFKLGKEIPNSSIQLIKTWDNSAVDKIAEPLMEDNWHDWKDCAQRVFTNCQITDYVFGKLPKPDHYTDPQRA